MKNFIKQNWPIGLIVLIAILISVGGYMGYKTYKNYQSRQTEEKRLISEKENKSQENLKAQQEALVKAQQEIEALKQKQVEQDKKSPQVIIKENLEEINVSEITAEELNPYFSTVVSIDCGEATGSGFLWQFENNNYSVITNKHVVEKTLYNESVGYFCWVTVNNIKGDGVASLVMNPNLHSSLNPVADIASSGLVDGYLGKKEDLNYKLTSMRKCSSLMPIGSPVVIIGYPAFAVQPNEVGNLKYERIVADGKISGYAEINLVTKEYLAIANYYVSAIVDSGNSGGIAISKNKEGLCLLGVPTWLKLGNFQTQGIVQNINNIF